MDRRPHALLGDEEAGDERGVDAPPVERGEEDVGRHRGQRHLAGEVQRLHSLRLQLHWRRGRHGNRWGWRKARGLTELCHRQRHRPHRGEQRQARRPCRGFRIAHPMPDLVRTRGRRGLDPAALRVEQFPGEAETGGGGLAQGSPEGGRRQEAEEAGGRPAGGSAPRPPDSSGAGPGQQDHAPRSQRALRFRCAPAARRAAGHASHSSGADWMELATAVRREASPLRKRASGSSPKMPSQTASRAAGYAMTTQSHHIARSVSSGVGKCPA